MSNKWLLGLVLGTCVGGFCAGAIGIAGADDLSSGARFSVVQGQVTVRGASGAQAAAPNVQLYPGDYIETGPTARAEVTLGGGDAVLRFAGGVQAHVIDAGQVQVADGTVEISILHSGTGTMQIDTPSVTVRASQKGIYRIAITSTGATQVTSRSGQIDIVTPHHTYTVESGQAMVATGKADNPTVVASSAVAYDSFDQFVADRDAALASNAGSYQTASSVYAPACNYVPTFYGNFGWGWGWGWNVSYGYAYTGGCGWVPTIAININPWWWNPWWYNPWGYGGYYACCGYPYSPYYAYGYPYGYYYPPRYPVGYHPVPIHVVPRPVTVPRTLAGPVDGSVPRASEPIAVRPIEASHPGTPIGRIATVPHERPIAISAPQTFKTLSTAPGRMEPSKGFVTDPWQRFDTGRGTHVAAQAPVVHTTDPVHVDPVHTDPVHTDPVKTVPAHGDPLHSDPKTTSTQWDRFTQTRGTVSVAPDPRSVSNPYEGIDRGSPSSGGGSSSGWFGSSHPSGGGTSGGISSMPHGSAPSAGGASGSAHGEPVHSSGGGSVTPHSGGGKPPNRR